MDIARKRTRAIREHIRKWVQCYVRAISISALELFRKWTNLIKVKRKTGDHFVAGTAAKKNEYFRKNYMLKLLSLKVKRGFMSGKLFEEMRMSLTRFARFAKYIIHPFRTNPITVLVYVNPITGRILELSSELKLVWGLISPTNVRYLRYHIVLSIGNTQRWKSKKADEWR